MNHIKTNISKLGKLLKEEEFAYLRNKRQMLKSYFRAMQIDYITPNLIASVALDNFKWELTSNEVIYLSDSL
jgi:hypothetical protein